MQMIVASETGKIPANLNYEKPNCNAVNLKEGRVTVATDLTPWDGVYSCVNTLSNCGAFGSIILKSHNIEKKNDGVPEDDVPRLAIVSGRTEEAVKTFLDFVRLIVIKHTIFGLLFFYSYLIIVFSLKVDQSM